MSPFHHHRHIRDTQLELLAPFNLQSRTTLHTEYRSAAYSTDGGTVQGRHKVDHVSLWNVMHVHEGTLPQRGMNSRLHALIGSGVTHTAFRSAQFNFPAKLFSACSASGGESFQVQSIDLLNRAASRLSLSTNARFSCTNKRTVRKFPWIAILHRVAARYYSCL